MSLPFPAAVIHDVLQAGVGEFVICAGARNSPLVVVLAALGDKVRLWQHFDERAAGFFAIGRIRATGNPVAVVTTSGTAVAELLPAVIEAHYQGLPLVALTADRPESFRGSGAPQAIEQAYLFSEYALSLDVTPDSLEEPADSSDISEGDCKNFRDWSGIRPLHVNACLEEPRPEELPALRESAAQMNLVLPEYIPMDRVEPSGLTPSADHLFMAGDLLEAESPAIIAAALSSGALVYAEASSGLWDAPALGGRLLRCGDATLRHLPLNLVSRFGGVPSVRFWRDLERPGKIEVRSCPRNDYPGLASEVEMLEFSKAIRFSRRQPVVPVHDILARDAALYTRLGELLTQFPNAEPALFRRLSRVIPQGATVFTGNSLAVREWNLCAEYGRGHHVHVLRGANGIDGNLSAFLGIAADKAEAWCITGDLTALYDLSAPWMLPQLPPGKRRFVVIQNGGGKIFSRLPSLRGLNERERALMENPHDIRLRGWAEMWGMDHLSGGGDILDGLDTLADHAVIELYPDAAQTEEFWLAWAQAEREIWL